MSSPEPVTRAARPSSAVARAVSGLSRVWQGRFFRDFCHAALWQGVGRLIQIVGVAYAARCLGAANLGISGVVMVIAANAQLVLDLGLDTVAVRHTAAQTAPLADVTRALFTFRLLVAAAAAAVWLAVVALIPMGETARWVWLLGAPYLVTLVMSYSWYFQATQRMPRFSFIQTVHSLGVSLIFLAAFHPQQAAGSDLLVTLIVNCLVGLATWWHIKQSNGFRLVGLRHLAMAKSLVAEARPNWLFNLSYFLLATMGLPLVQLCLRDETQSGLYRSAAMMVTPLQLLLNSFGTMLIPRIVIWRHSDPAQFRRRVFQLVVGLGLGGLAVFGAVWLLQRPIYRLIYGAEFLPGAGLLPILVLAKFFSAGTAVLVWALFAQQRDWLAVQCCVWPMAVSFGLHLLLLPQFGITAAAWLNCGAEAALVGLCALAFARVQSRRRA